ncbi:MAG: hypothetical protein MUF34_06495 [Polyangiaceae bacterium]|nr:hypothetical protein [Polyangiaceae bacterium]
MRAGLVAFAAGLAVSLSPRGGARANPLTWAGRSVGAGLLESAIAPGIDRAEGGGRRLLADFEGRLDRQIAHVGGTLDASLTRADELVEVRVKQVDDVTRNRLQQADVIMAARIAQIDTSLDERLSKAVGEFGARAELSGKAVVRELDATTKARLQQADDIMNARVAQIGEAVDRAVDEADQAAAERIDQVDETVSRSIGGIDTVSTKIALNLEQALVRLAALGALLAFLVFLLRRGYTDVADTWEKLDGPTAQRTKRAALQVARGLAVRVAAGLSCVLVLWLAYRYLTSGENERTRALVTMHEKALAMSERTLDLVGLKQHAAQLALLDPERAPSFRARTLKWQLVRDVLARPGGLRRRTGRPGELEAGLAEVKALLEASEGHDDPDLLTVEAYRSWQRAGARADEHRAATLCARALEASPSFVLRPLALGYLRAFLHNAPPGEAPAPLFPIDRLRRTLGQVSGEGAHFAPMQYVLDYNERVARLDATAGDAYVAMIEAHAAYLTARSRLGPKEREPAAGSTAEGLSPAQVALLEAKRRRLDQARLVVEAWRAFDASTAAPELDAAGVGLGLFLLNDAPLSRARWLIEKDDAAIEGPGPRVADEPDARVRGLIAPVRVSWARRYVDPLGGRLRHLLVFEAANHFDRFEGLTLAFERALVDLRRAEAEGRGGDLPRRRVEAAQRAAELGLYQGTGPARSPYGLRLLGEGAPAEDRARVVDAYGQRHLRFL